MLTTEQAEQFRRDGYLIDQGVFSSDELEALREMARRVQEKTRATLPSGTRFWYGVHSENRDAIPPEQRPLATWGVNEITRLELLEVGLVDTFAHPRVHAALHALLGDESRAWGIKILWTPKIIGYDLQWHRDLEQALYDTVHLKPAAQDHVQFNAALNYNDCFVVVPGSHRRPLTEEEWRAIRSDKTALLPGEVNAVLEPGDILYMDAHTLHRGRSTTDGDRLTLHYSAQTQWVPLKEWGDPAHFAWISSPEFIGRLAPGTRPLYERLHTARRTDDASGHLRPEGG